jgi:hypothetical protein
MDRQVLLGFTLFVQSHFYMAVHASSNLSLKALMSGESMIKQICNGFLLWICLLPVYFRRLKYQTFKEKVWDFPMCAIERYVGEF